jgi:hypothetical protein
MQIAPLAAQAEHGHNKKPKDKAAVGVSHALNGNEISSEMGVKLTDVGGRGCF